MDTTKHREFIDEFFISLMDAVNLSAFFDMDKQDMRHEIDQFLRHKCKESDYTLLYHEHQVIVTEVLNNIIGLGPLEPLVKDPAITDILVNGYDDIYIERKGKLEKADIRFYNDQHTLRICQRIVNRISGRSIDESTPLADARLLDGSRVNIIIPPLALNGPCISIRKFSSFFISLDQMVLTQNLSQQISTFLKLISGCRLNIIVLGGTGSGKTTLLSALSEHIDNNERIVTVEDAAELKIQCPHLVRLESRPQNMEGKGEITIRQLVKNALRMRPDRIIVGECRGQEAFDMLQAMNTGHDGSMNTIHANNAPEALGRMENMILMANLALPSSAIRGFIGDAIDIIVQISRMRDGHRRIASIYEIGRYEDQIIQTNQLFDFVYSSEKDNILQGEFEIVNPPKFIVEKVRDYGKLNELNKIFQEP